MGTKLPKDTYPAGTGPADFQCFGPPALTDGEFDSCKIADLGCFEQEEKDSNKYYHGAMVKDKSQQGWFVYFEWGRTGAAKISFQFVECDDEGDAQAEFKKQLLSKNLKRGIWTTIAGIKTLRPKPKKDLYLVRPQATRSTGLPDARSIKTNEGASPSSKGAAALAKSPVGKAKNKTSAPKTDRETLALMRDLNVATADYTRGAMADSSVPTQAAIDQARDVLTEAQKRLVNVGDDIDDQINDKDLGQLTRVLYSRIPKKKRVGAPKSTWVLSKDNIMAWNADLDAFESTLYSHTDTQKIKADPFGGMNLKMEWINPNGSLGRWISRFSAKSTRNKHGWVGNMRVKNMWSVARHGDEKNLFSTMDRIAAERTRRWNNERALFQEDRRPDYKGTRLEAYVASNTALLFHGTRSVNVSGILRKSLLLPRQLVGVVITGAMFGPGLYFADDWKKSAGYTSLSGSYWSGGSGTVQNRHAFMFLCDVVLGNPHIARGPSGFTGCPSGFNCIFGKANVSNVQNNEWVVFNVRQNMLRYLIEFDAR